MTTQNTLPVTLLRQVLDGLTAGRVDHALVREPSRDGLGLLEADLLVAPASLDRVEQQLAALGFARRPAWGRRPHRFYVRPIVDDGRVDWLKIDLVTDLSFGRWHELTTGIAVRCLAEHDRTDPDRLAPADELLAQLLHGLLDGRGLGAKGRARLVALLPRATRPAALAAWATPEDAGWPTWTAITDAIRGEDWAAIESMAGPLEARLASGRAREVAVRRTANRAARRSVKALTALAGRGQVVALVGPDGTGKSTLAAGVADSIAMPARVLYGGTYRSGTRTSRLPGASTALVGGRLLATRAQVAWYRARGRLVILDRHPVEARPAPGDALPARTRVRRTLLSVTLARPDLLIALDAPAALLHERRPEHDVDHLDRDRLRHLDLAARTEGCEVLDAAAAADEVRGRTVRLVWERVVAGRPLPTTTATEPARTGSAA